VTAPPAEVIVELNEVVRILNTSATPLPTDSAPPAMASFGNVAVPVPPIVTVPLAGPLTEHVNPLNEVGPMIVTPVFKFTVPVEPLYQRIPKQYKHVRDKNAHEHKEMDAIIIIIIIHANIRQLSTACDCHQIIKRQSTSAPMNITRRDRMG
jgi:hypothetical protein